LSKEPRREWGMVPRTAALAQAAHNFAEERNQSQNGKESIDQRF
jgi:hypothetical protein